MIMKNDLGLVHVYTGNGKGKTTAALGLALRAVGHGLKVYMIQFMKGSIDYGELIASRQIQNLTIKQFGRAEFVDKENPKEVDISLAEKALSHAKIVLAERKYDVVILDEINVALEWKLINLNDVIELIQQRPTNVELILTGRYAPPKIIAIADLVTEMKERKHPYQKGIEARKGIDY